MKPLLLVAGFLVAINAAMPSGTSLKLLDQALPKQYFDVGIAEEHAALRAGVTGEN